MSKISNIEDFQNVFFIGVAGVGMSAIAQYLTGIGKEVSGSDRYFHPNEYNKTKEITNKTQNSSKMDIIS